MTHTVASAVTGAGIVDAVAPLRGRTRVRLALLADLRCAELANALGLAWRLSNLKRVLFLAVAAMVVLIPAAAFGFARLFALVSTQAPAPALLVPLASVLIFTSGAGLLWSEIMGKYRTSVSGHPNISFFRSLDIPALLVHTVYVVPRLGLAMGFWLLASSGFLAGLLSTGPAGPWILIAGAGMLLQPLLWFAAAILASLWLASRNPAAGLSFGWGVLFALLAGGTVGWLVAGILPTFNVGVEPVLAAPSHEVPGQEHGLAAVVALTVAVLILAGLGLPAAKVLRRRSFVLAAVGAGMRGGSRPVTGVLAGTLAWFWLRTLRRQRLASWRKLAENRTGWVLCAVIGALLALRLSGAWERAGLDGVLAPLQSAALPTVALAAVVLGIAVAELTLGDLSRRVVGPALRAAVELGAPVRIATAVHAASLFGPALMVGALASVLVGVLLGWPLAAVPVIIAAGACAGSILAEHIFPPPRTVDGGAGESVATALTSLVLATLPAIWTLLVPAFSVVLLPLTAAALVGGALWCVRRNLITL
ncbi:hypothetical protein PSET11_00501 [Arthrobacter ulcerisalmonis]|uniref:Uncharacterized protein n=1 Tax=Arthrobacter ulcerisalmonis TaxID=2483813 RepID=A0A3P5WGX0_9MICC|nr:hypothetical protein [Arthrobacter ulcerisalmonis]VDC18737.1 hypothetical protein PSET11_00501 [Arthrobacter ulcerisalmonis]